MANSTETKRLGYLRACMDRRFVEKTRQAFEKATGLGPEDYWMETYPGGAALTHDPLGVDYATQHGATIYGWQAHGDHCGGQPGVGDEEIEVRVNQQISVQQEMHPGEHFRIFATEAGIEVTKVK